MKRRFFRRTRSGAKTASIIYSATSLLRFGTNAGSVSSAHAITNEIRFRDEQSYVDRFNELFSQAVSDRLRTDRVSVSLSGGLDSTSIAVVARELLQKPDAVQAFSTVYDELIPDEERHYST